MKKKSLLHKTMTMFVVCVIFLFALAAPLFYFLTKNYYAEDMEDLREAIAAGSPLPPDDLERDVMHGIMLQYLLMSTTLGIAVVFTMRIISRHIWHPFDETLRLIEDFKLENNIAVDLHESDISEFERLNAALRKLTDNSLASYRAQKEFTENASHELQTPLAVFRSKLDMLMQQPQLTCAQASIIQDLNDVVTRLARMNRNLLLLAKIENNQFDHAEDVNLNDLTGQMLPYFQAIAGDVKITCNAEKVCIRANRTLLESVLGNLVTNALRHNITHGKIVITVQQTMLRVSNTSDGPALDPSCLFNRFFRVQSNGPGNGLGLAIVKAICDYHGWQVEYAHSVGMHHFTISFMPKHI